MSNFWFKSGTSQIVVNGSNQPCLNASCPCSSSGCSMAQKADGVVQSGTTLTNTWGASTTAGNLLVAVVGITGVAAVSSPPAGWSVAANFSTFNGAVYIYYIANSASRSGTESFGLSVSTTHGWVELMEFASSGSSFDVSAHNSGTSTSPDSGTTGTTNYANEICVAGIWYNGSSAAFSGPTNGFTLQSNINSSGTYYGAVLTKFPNATGTQDTGVTGTGSQAWVGVIATFVCNGVIESACCSNGIPTTLHCTITDVSGCSCMAGTYTATYVASGIGTSPPDGWRLQITMCSGKTLDVFLQCNGAPFGWSITDCHLLNNSIPLADCQVGQTFETSDTCSPFDVKFSSVGMVGTCCTGSALATFEFSP